MCLILLAYNSYPDYKLLLAANRDEFYERPSAPLEIWADNPRIAAGRDLRGGGTWMGVSPDGRLAALTNYRDPKDIKPNAPTRGTLVTDFLSARTPACDYLENLRRSADKYNGFNLVVYDGEELWFFSNREEKVKSIRPGWHGLSNHLLDTPWPKVARGVALFKTAAAGGAPSPEAVFNVLGDRTQPPDNQLPETGVGLEWERILAPLFIKSAVYGTRCSSLVTIDHSGRLDFYERTHDSQTDPAGPAPIRHITFRTNAING